MQLAFILNMPGNNSWDGKWSGEGRLYAIVKTFSSQKAQLHATQILAEGSYGYNFGDGWYARVDVKAVDASESRKIRKNSKGFCGYDWMVESIERHGKILNSLQERELRDEALHAEPMRHPDRELA